MTEVNQLEQQAESSSGGVRGSVQHVCDTARSLQEAGNYEAARNVLERFWPAGSERPNTQGLEELEAAELLLTCGAVASSLGDTNLSKGPQETAKDMVGEALGIFNRSGRKEKSAEAHCDLAICYWREGGLEEARSHIREALERLGDEQPEQKAVALLRGAVIELSATKLNEALAMLDDAAPLFAATGSHVLKGKFHANRGIVLKNLSAGDNREAYADRALIEMEAASFHFEQAHLPRYRAYNENNLGSLFFTLNRLREAEMHLSRASRLFNELEDEASSAQVSETRARVMLQRGRYAEAEKLMRASVRTLEKGDKQSLLAEALTTRGVVEARLYKFREAVQSFQRARDIAARAGASQQSGLPALEMIEELGEELDQQQITSAFSRAYRALITSEDKQILVRLAKAAGHLVQEEEPAEATEPVDGGESTSAPEEEVPGRSKAAGRAAALRSSGRWHNFNFLEDVVRYENILISDALNDAGGRVSVAARLLDMTYQGLTQRLSTRNRAINAKRKPPVKRRRSLIKRR